MIYIVMLVIFARFDHEVSPVFYLRQMKTPRKETARR